MSRIVTGDRPTGALHLGHYVGTLASRVALQQAGDEIFVLVADYQVITDRDRAEDPVGTVLELVLDYLAVGLDPEQTVIYAHSAVPAVNQLMLPFLSLVSVSELNRNPTVKDEIAHSQQSSVSALMFTYPVHQAADVLALRGDLVPVGRDQLPHLELMRTIARRFNERYGPTLVVPEARLGEIPLLPGLDGGKMSKSRGNTIALTDPTDVVAGKIRAAVTDGDRTIGYDPGGRPGVSALVQLGAYARGVAPEVFAASIGDRGAAVLKAAVTEAVESLLVPMRARRAQYSRADAAAILARGAVRANAEADAVLAAVRTAMGQDYVAV